MDDIEIPDDDTETNARIESMIFRPSDTHDLKSWIVQKLLIEGPYADLNSVDLSEITNMDFLFSYSTKHPIYFYDTTQDSIYNYLPVRQPDVEADAETYLKEIEECQNFIINNHNSFWNKFGETFTTKAAMNGQDQLEKIFQNFNSKLDWDVSKVECMRHMFDGCTEFDQPIGGWDVSKVTGMASMFQNTHSFNQPLADWNLDTDIFLVRDMFLGASKFNKDISNWKLVSKMKIPYEFYHHYAGQLWTDMFEGCPISKENKPQFNYTGYN